MLDWLGYTWGGEEEVLKVKLPVAMLVAQGLPQLLPSWLQVSVVLIHSVLHCTGDSGSPPTIQSIGQQRKVPALGGGAENKVSIHTLPFLP